MFGKHRHERPSPYAHAVVTNAFVGGALAVSVRTAYHVSRSFQQSSMLSRLKLWRQFNMPQRRAGQWLRP